jgi:Immunoglobulin I-set domain
MKFMFGRAVLTIKQLRVDDSGVYMVKAHNGAGNIQSTATLHVQPQVERAPALPAYSSGANVAPTYGNDLQRATGYSNSQKTTTYNTSSTTVIQTAPTFMRHLEPDYNVLEGSRLHMEVRAEPTQGQDLQFTWLKNGAPIQSGKKSKIFVFPVRNLQEINN